MSLNVSISCLLYQLSLNVSKCWFFVTSNVVCVLCFLPNVTKCFQMLFLIFFIQSLTYASCIFCETKLDWKWSTKLNRFHSWGVVFEYFWWLFNDFFILLRVNSWYFLALGPHLISRQFQGRFWNTFTQKKNCLEPKFYIFAINCIIDFWWVPLPCSGNDVDPFGVWLHIIWETFSRYVHDHILESIILKF